MSEQGWRRFLNEEQDPAIVENAWGRVSAFLMPDEGIEYIAVQKKPGLTISPAVVVITNRRFLVYKSRLMGQVDMADHRWRDLRDVRINEVMTGAVLTFQLTNGQQIAIESLPKGQARRIYQYAQQREEHATEERRQRDLEDKRAAAGGVFVQTNVPTGPLASPGPLPMAPGPQVIDMPTQALPSPAAPALLAGPAPDDPVARLKQLKAMLDADLISQAEYDTKKTDILSRM